VSRVLAVDDSPPLLGMLVKCLRDGGHEVTTATNGREALDALRERRPEMVITDLNMPEMTGLEFIAAARAEAFGQGVPILLLTSETAPELKARARQVRATGWLDKPLDADRVLALVRELA
jgi:two-component system, chemotaxis family, chemotaxis protein CheY